jgi:molybdate transport system substrate-binding protein
VRKLRTLAVVLALCACARVGAAEPERVTVAVAANFTKTAEQLARMYEATNPQAQIRFSPGSSGKLHAQIENGAPFDIFLSADGERPALLEQKGYAVAGSRFTYALGRLVLWSNDAKLAGKDCRQALIDIDFRHVAIANPKTAPYGVAAVAVLEKLGIGPQRLGPLVVQGENIAQTLQFVASGSAQLGFVPLSQLGDPGVPAGSCRWDIPADLHPPIVQQAVLLKRAAGNKAAVAFHEFLKSDVARKLIASHGYDTATLIAGN